MPTPNLTVVNYCKLKFLVHPVPRPNTLKLYLNDHTNKYGNWYIYPKFLVHKS